MTDVPAKIRAGALACISISMAAILFVGTGGQIKAHETLGGEGAQSERASASSPGAAVVATESSRPRSIGSADLVTVPSPDTRPDASTTDGLTSATLVNQAPVETETSAQFKVGARVDPDRLHIVTRPGLYGMGRPPPGNRYGILNGRLIRFDPETMHVLSVIRHVEQILD